MTRINTVPPKDLNNQHLLKEYKDIKRPVELAIRSFNNIGIHGIKQIQPDRYRFDTNHVLFFYDKLRYLYNRFKDITEEMRNRDMNPTETFDYFEIPIDLFNDWEPTEFDIESNKSELLYDSVWWLP